MGIGGDMTTTSIPNEPRRRLWRSRWAAIGAAVAVTFGGGGFFIAEAASGPESSMVMIDPVRILDTRDPVNVGLDGPFVSAISQKLQVAGSVPTTAGPQTVVPTGATGVLLNVTAVGATANGFISIRPGDAAGSPATSSLNVTAGVTVPNAVQVALPLAGANAGKIDITWDALGVAGPTTDILIDVVGYTTDAKLNALQAEIDALAAVVANSKPIMRSARVEDVAPDPEGTRKVIATVTINAPVDGTVQLVGSTWEISNTTGTVTCNLTSGAGNTSNVGELADTDRTLDLFEAEKGFCSTNGAIKVTAGTHTLNLVASARAGMDLADTTLDAIFTPGGSIIAT
jgi:hypothetical protein